VTPKQVENLIETTGGDTDYVDGYDELPPEFQAKIDYALKNGHVADEDWKDVSLELDVFLFTLERSGPDASATSLWTLC
jgi:hypothetical protein